MTILPCHHVLHSIGWASCMIAGMLAISGCVGTGTADDAAIRKLMAYGEDRANALAIATDRAGQQCVKSGHRLQILSTRVTPPDPQAEKDLHAPETLPPALGEIAAGSQEGEFWRVELGYRCQ
ncbi:hypothetical protein [Kushneria phosphatilytica]|uniref:Uncharacterized protein n=1 Tax=Kushneria phosphatilytica TaxID=657387 RepID=A0A1S1NYK4_9GAMM|nr:hypothetical protein [Kushneria phosphatilytica]OHV12945.1 hypothetical protein BH688_02785 [Kushneria phosphatilytica]QEL10813.1 hypothetical protein FY550_06550 [Kushneria phosphatilytica]